MADNQEKPERLELPVHGGRRLWPYLLGGALLGAAFEMLINLPLDVVFTKLFEYLFAGNPPRLTQALRHLAWPGEWPAVSLTGFFLGAALGYAFYRLKENQRRVQSLHQEFEIQVAALRHHYKNLAIGIAGFSSRAKRKLEQLQQHIRDCGPAEAAIKTEVDTLHQNVAILEDASQRLASTLTEELAFLKAMQSNILTLTPQDFFPVLRHAIQELLELRYRDKAIRVEINGQPFQKPHAPLIFPFDAYTMEIILQNILSNAMRFGDFIQVKVDAGNKRITVEIRDNGPGVDVQVIRRIMSGSGKSQEAGSTQLGLRVTLHLLEKCGGRLFVSNQPGGGAAFILEFPR